MLTDTRHCLYIVINRAAVSKNQEHLTGTLTSLLPVSADRLKYILYSIEKKLKCEYTCKKFYTICSRICLSVLTEPVGGRGHRRDRRYRGRQGSGGAGGDVRNRRRRSTEVLIYSEATGRQYEKGELTELPYTFKRRKVHE